MKVHDLERSSTRLQFHPLSKGQYLSFDWATQHFVLRLGDPMEILSDLISINSKHFQQMEDNNQPLTIIVPIIISNIF